MTRVVGLAGTGPVVVTLAVTPGEDIDDVDILTGEDLSAALDRGLVIQVDDRA